MHGDQQDAAAVGASKAGLEKMDERHVNFAERDGFNLHGLEFRLRGCQISMAEDVQHIGVRRRLGS